MVEESQKDVVTWKDTKVQNLSQGKFEESINSVISSYQQHVMKTIRWLGGWTRCPTAPAQHITHLSPSGLDPISEGLILPSISPSSVVELNTTSVLANYATETDVECDELTDHSECCKPLFSKEDLGNTLKQNIFVPRPHTDNKRGIHTFQSSDESLICNESASNSSNSELLTQTLFFVGFVSITAAILIKLVSTIK
uniref:Uncharacterized protein n=1 Tax=Timema poppense TaxID=170557 RepID=A0A7R9DGX5_TIMPO|nr:unnamed protein product [Timema poppensis]